MFKATNKKQCVLFWKYKTNLYAMGLPGKLSACPTAS